MRSSFEDGSAHLLIAIVLSFLAILFIVFVCFDRFKGIEENIIGISGESVHHAAWTQTTVHNNGKSVTFSHINHPAYDETPIYSKYGTDRIRRKYPANMKFNIVSVTGFYTGWHYTRSITDLSIREQ
jgi:hypothetical protein